MTRQKAEVERQPLWGWHSYSREQEREHKGRTEMALGRLNPPGPRRSNQLSPQTKQGALTRPRVNTSISFVQSHFHLYVLI